MTRLADEIERIDDERNYQRWECATAFDCYCRIAGITGDELEQRRRTLSILLDLLPSKEAINEAK